VVIAAAVLGGTNVQGGAGSVPGVLCGCLLLGALSTALTVLKIEATWQAAVYGAVIVLAVLADELIRRRLARLHVPATARAAAPRAPEAS
jgi:ribose/xylose/arabinose/galactoside ABC-type transport system permease subunit